jgi:uncharacterized SAM-binding protein YcdF (DUF218 family)
LPLCPAESRADADIAVDASCKATGSRDRTGAGRRPMRVADVGSDVARALLLPPASLTLLVLAALALRRRWPAPGRVAIGLGILLLYFTATPLGATLLLRSLETDPALPTETVTDAGAIVLLGGDLYDHGPEYGGDTVGPLSLERVRYAARLQRRTGLPVLVTGGLLRGHDIPISLIMRRVLVEELAVPVSWIETQSRDTWENAQLSAPILRRAGVRKILLVTQAWHMRRARIAFAAAGIDVVGAPTHLTRWPGDLFLLGVPSGHAVLMSSYAAHEWLGVLWYAGRRAISPSG